MQLSKEIGVQCRTVWYRFQRIREACAAGEFKLNNVVEMDETYLGGKIDADDSRTYNGLKLNRQSVNHSHKQWSNGDLNTNSIESVWVVFKRSIKGTGQHVSPAPAHRPPRKCGGKTGNVSVDGQITAMSEVRIIKIGGASSYRDTLGFGAVAQTA